MRDRNCCLFSILSAGFLSYSETLCTSSCLPFLQSSLYSWPTVLLTFLAVTAAFTRTAAIAADTVADTSCGGHYWEHELRDWSQRRSICANLFLTQLAQNFEHVPDAACRQASEWGRKGDNGWRDDPAPHSCMCLYVLDDPC